MQSSNLKVVVTVVVVVAAAAAAVLVTFLQKLAEMHDNDNHLLTIDRSIKCNTVVKHKAELEQAVKNAVYIILLVLVYFWCLLLTCCCSCYSC